MFRNRNRKNRRGMVLPFPRRKIAENVSIKEEKSVDAARRQQELRRELKYKQWKVSYMRMTGRFPSPELEETMKKMAGYSEEEEK